MSQLSPLTRGWLALDPEQMFEGGKWKMFYVI
jgi:hypothetical protein